MQHYIYDASGERVLKAGSDFEGVYENGTLTSASSVSFNTYTTYPSAFMVIDGYGQYSKHYFAGSQRIVSRIGSGESTQFNCEACKNTEQLTKLKQAQTTDLQHYMDLAKKGTVGFKTYKPEDARMPYNPCEGLTGPAYEECCAATPGCNPPAYIIPKIYYFHPDHLGTSTFLTDANGNSYQFFLNLPFGETMAEQKSITQNFATPYKFTGKELDEETGLYYFGARYYDPKNSIWLGVDPLAEEYQNVSPYVYCVGNPLNLIDPDGNGPLKPPVKGSPEWNEFYNNYKNDKYHKGGNGVNWNDKDGSWTYNSKSQTWIGIGASKGNNISAVSSIQESNIGFNLSFRIGGLSLSFGPEIAVGNATNGLNVAARTISSFSFDARKFFSTDAWLQSKVDLKASMGIKISNEPTLVTGFKTNTNVFEKLDFNLFGSGGEFKMSQPTSGSNTTSYNVGLKLGATASTELNQTIGTEVKATSTSLATDQNDGGY